MPRIRGPLCVVALMFAACPDVPSVDPVVPDVQASWDAEETPIAPPLGFDDCETAEDCATRPNSASLCDHQSCVLDCFPGFSDCDYKSDNGCEQSLSQLDHCGGCDVPCAFPQGIAACPDGQCILDECDKKHGGYGDCDGDTDNGCETRLNVSTDCGGCGVLCAPPNALGACDVEDREGECLVATCHPGFGDCDAAADNGCETEVQSRLRCGGCDTMCAPGHGCAADLPAPDADEDVSPSGFHCSPIVGSLLPHGSPSAIAVGPDGALYAALTATEPLSWGDETLEVRGPSDAVLRRYTPEGVADWSRRIGGLNTDTAVALAVDAAGRITLTGTYQSGASLAGGLLPTLGGVDVFVVQYDDTGTQVQDWGFGTGGPGDDLPTALVADSDGSVVVVGTTEPPASFGGAILTGTPDTPVGFVARYVPTSAADWSAFVSSASPVTLTDVDLDGDGGVHVLASSTSPLVLDGVEVAPAGHAVLTWSVDGAYVASQSVPLDAVSALAVIPGGGIFVAGDGQVVRLGEEASSPIGLEGVTDLTAGAGGALHLTGHTNGAFDLGLGPVIVDGVFAARYDTHTGDVVWFVGLDDAGTAPQIAATTHHVLVSGQSLTPLAE